MGNRRRSRELAIQALFFMDMQKQFSGAMLDRFCTNFDPPRQVLPFFLLLVQGVIGAKTDIDGLIETFSDNWKLNRMSGVDRNVIRMAVFELLCCQDIPPKVTINEAIDLGKKFGSDESGAFINGILDSVRTAIDKGLVKPDVFRKAAGIENGIADSGAAAAED